MKTKVIVFLLIAAVAASAGYLLLGAHGTDGHIARITRDGVLLEEIDLDQVEMPYFLPFEDENGSNMVFVEKGFIRVSWADCPDQVCVNQGRISDSTVPIVCLPHKLIVEIVGGGGELDGGAG